MSVTVIDLIRSEVKKIDQQFCKNYEKNVKRVEDFYDDANIPRIFITEDTEGDTGSDKSKSD